MFGLNDRGLGVLCLLLQLTTNFAQPIFGYLVDRFRWHNVIPLSLLVSTVFVCFVGFVPGLPLFALFVMLSGLGVALFHPRGAALAAEASGSRRAFGMSVFGVGGTVGVIGASLLGPVLHNLGLRFGLGPLQGFVVLLPVGLAGMLLLVRYNPGRPPGAAGGSAAGPEPPIFSLRRHLLPHLPRLAPLLAVTVLRSATVIAYANFIQVLQGRHGHSTLFQGVVLFSFMAGAAIGGLVGAHLSDRYGRRFMTVLTLLLSPPLLYYALFAPPLGVLVLLFLAGAMLRGAESVNIAQVQDLLPHGMSTASAIAMGLTWGVAGFILPVVGQVSEWQNNLSLALATTCVLPIIAAVVALRLPTKPGDLQEHPLPAAN
jgi:FSR family fosmidomycin resistance protein-like MFS transporter